MRRTRDWTRLRNSFLALGLVAAAAGLARADSITNTTPTNTATPTADLGSALLAYDTSGSSVGTTGVTFTGLTADPKAISFSPTAGGSFLAPSSLSLGAFQTAALGAGQSVTYNNTPFDVKFTADGLKVNGVDGGPISPNQTPIDITGYLNGTLAGPNQSSVTATFNKPAVVGVASTDPATYAFLTGIYANTMKITDNPLTIVPSSTNNGTTSAQAFMNSMPTGTPSLPSSSSTVPEPSTVMLFGATIVGLGFRHRIRKARGNG